MRNKDLALRVLSTAATLSIVTSIAASAFAGTYDLSRGSISVSAKDGKQTISQRDKDDNYVSDSKGEIKDREDDDIKITTKDVDDDDKTSGSAKETNNTVDIKVDAGSSAKVKLEDVKIKDEDKESSGAAISVDVKEKDSKADITLSNTTVDTSKTGNADTGVAGEAAVSVTGKGDVELELDGKNELTSGAYRAGLEKNDITDEEGNNVSGSLTIKDDKNDDGSAKGTDEDTTGELTATGGEGGNGSKYGGCGGGAGIGGAGGAGLGEAAESGKGTSNITITGGNIKATGKGNGAGIGGGGGSFGSDINGGNAVIKITGGTIDAFGSLGGGYGAGIGSGGTGDRDGSHSRGKGGDATIEITGGTIKRAGSYLASGIGSGNRGNSNITISGKNTTIINCGGGSASAAIGSVGGSSTIHFKDGVTIELAKGGDYSVGIGTTGGTCDITIENSTIKKATSGQFCGIGIGSYDGDGSSVVRIINSVIGVFTGSGKDMSYVSDGAIARTIWGPSGYPGIGGTNCQVFIDNSSAVAAKGTYVDGIGDGSSETKVTPIGDGELNITHPDENNPYLTVILPTHWHTHGNWTVTKEPTCVDEGLEEEKCPECGARLDSRAIAPTGQHKWSGWTEDRDAGTRSRHCTVCGLTQTEALPTPTPDENSSDATTALELWVTDADGLNSPFAVTQNGTVRTYTANADVATLNGNMEILKYLKEHGAETIVFATNQQTSQFNIDDVLAQASGNESFYLAHNGAEEAQVVVVG